MFTHILHANTAFIYGCWYGCFVNCKEACPNQQVMMSEHQKRVSLNSDFIYIVSTIMHIVSRCYTKSGLKPSQKHPVKYSGSYAEDKWTCATDWPQCLLDLSPIEHHWDIMFRFPGPDLWGDNPNIPSTDKLRACSNIVRHAYNIMGAIQTTEDHFELLYCTFNKIDSYFFHFLGCPWISNLCRLISLPL